MGIVRRRGAGLDLDHGTSEEEWGLGACTGCLSGREKPEVRKSGRHVSTRAQCCRRLKKKESPRGRVIRATANKFKKTVAPGRFSPKKRRIVSTFGMYKGTPTRHKAASVALS